MTRINHEQHEHSLRRQIFVLLFFVFVFSFAGVAEAEVQSIVSADSGGFIQSIANLYKYAQTIGIALAIFMITAGGIYIAISGASPSKQQEGKDMIKSAIFGLVLLFGAVLILNTINPRLTLLSAPTRRSVSLGVRPCNRGDIASSTLISADCDFKCNGDPNKGEDAYTLLSDENKAKYGCVLDDEICTDPKNAEQARKIAEGKCTYFLRPCNKNEDPEFPPKCFAENQACSVAVMRYCTPAVLTFGAVSSDLQSIQEEIQQARAVCNSMPATADITPVETATGEQISERQECLRNLDSLEGEQRESIEAGNAGQFIDALVPACTEILAIGGCKDGINEERNAPVITPGARYKRLPYYPSRSGPRDAACILVAYEEDTGKDEDEDGQNDIKIKDFKNRGDLKPCPPSTSFSGASATSTFTITTTTAGTLFEADRPDAGAGVACPLIPSLTPRLQEFHNEKRALLNSSIGVSSSCDCPNPNYARCTGLINLPPIAIDRLNKLKADCPRCNITITGGTEVGHRSHGPNKPVVDLQWDTATAQRLKANSTDFGVVKICTTLGDARYRISCDGYNEEKRHIHVEFAR